MPAEASPSTPTEPVPASPAHGTAVASASNATAAEVVATAVETFAEIPTESFEEFVQRRNSLVHKAVEDYKARGNNIAGCLRYLKKHFRRALTIEEHNLLRKGWDAPLLEEDPDHHMEPCVPVDILTAREAIV